MKRLIALQFDLQPRPRQTSRECLAAVRDVLAEWLRGIFRGSGVHDVQVAFDGSRVAPAPGHEVRAEQRECATHQLASLEWRFPEPRDPALVWQFTGVVACEGRSVQTALQIRVGWRSLVLRPLEIALDLHNPLSTIAGLRDQLLLGWSCRVAGQPVPTHPRPLRKSHVDKFVREALFNPDRVLPVVLLALNGPLQLDSDALEALQAHVRGLAQVAAVLDQAAAERLRKLAGPEFFPADCAVRLYWPGASRDGRPQAHPYQTFEHLAKNLQSGTLHDQLLSLLLPVSADAFREGDVIGGARAALEADLLGQSRAGPAGAARLAALEADLCRAVEAEQRLQREGDVARRHVQALLDDLADLREQLAVLRAASPRGKDAEFDELTSALERAWDENKRLQGDCDTARRRLAELEAEFRKALDNVAPLPQGPGEPEAAVPAAEPGGRHFDSVAGALRAAAAEFADVLTVWEDAEQSAEQSSFSSPAKVFRALEAVAEVGRAYFRARDGGPPLGPVDRAFLSRVPFKYTGFESQTTLSLFGAERVFHHRGDSRQMQRHLTLGGGTTNNCLQVYFEFDDASRRVLIGHCGRHLRYYRQRT
jgi:hypothetical protein